MTKKKTNLTLKYLPEGGIELFEQEVGPPGRGELQVAGGVCGVCSWDLATVRYGEKFPAMAPPGHEGLAHVVAVGDGVEGFEVGQRVACGPQSGEPLAGAFSTCRNVPAERVYPIPESDLADTYWLVEPASCVVTGVDHCHVKIADKIVVLGCGYMGLMFIQALQRSFAGEVIGLDIADWRLEKARELGLKETYNIGGKDADDLIDQLFRRDIDTVVDTSGSAQGFDAACRIVKRNGRLNMFGWVKEQKSPVNLSRFHQKAIQIVNTPPAARLRDPFPAAIEAIRAGIFDMRPLVSDIVKLREYPSLMDKALSGDRSYIKGVVRLED